MNKLFCILVLFAINIYCNAEVEKKVAGNSTAGDSPEVILKQLEKFYPYLWEMEHEELKQYSIGESSNDIDNIYTFKIKEVKPNGALSKRLEIAQREGFFDIMEKAAAASDKSVFDFLKFQYPPKEIGVLLVCKYIYYLRILRYMEQEEWSKAIHDLTIWSDVVFLVSPNGTFKQSIQRLVEHSLLTYKIPTQERTYLINLNEKLKEKQ